MNFIFLKKTSSKVTFIIFVIFLHSCGGGGVSQGNISNEFSSESESSSESISSGSNQNSNVDQSSSLNVEIVENRFGECVFGECKFE